MCSFGEKKKVVLEFRKTHFSFREAPLQQTINILKKQTHYLDFVRFNAHLHEFCFTHLVHKVKFYTKHNPHVKKDKKSHNASHMEE